jgi:hypothetical protein
VAAERFSALRKDSSYLLPAAPLPPLYNACQFPETQQRTITRVTREKPVTGHLGTITSELYKLTPQFLTRATAWLAQVEEQLQFNTTETHLCAKLESEEAIRRSQAPEADVEEIYQLFERQLRAHAQIEAEATSVNPPSYHRQDFEAISDALSNRLAAVLQALHAIDDSYQQQIACLASIDLADIQTRCLAALQVAPVDLLATSRQRRRKLTVADILTTLKRTHEKVQAENTRARAMISREITFVEDIQQIQQAIIGHIDTRLAALPAHTLRHEESRNDVLTSIRNAMSHIGAILLEVYEHGNAFHREEYQELTEKLRKARLARLQSRVQEFEDATRKAEQQLSVQSTRVWQIRGVLKQYGVSVAPGSSVTGEAPSSTPPEQDELLRRVQEKERQQTAEAVAQVQTLEDYAAALTAIRQANQDLQGRVSEQQAELLASLVCPITQEVMMDPVVAADGHTYERRAIEIWLAQSDRSPLTNSPLSSRALQPNWLVRSMLSKLRDQAPVPAGLGSSSLFPQASTSLALPDSTTASGSSFSDSS